MGQSETSAEWVTVLVVKHNAGSREGAIYERNMYDRVIAEQDGEVVMAWTSDEREAMGEQGVGFRVFAMLANDEGTADG